MECTPLNHVIGDDKFQFYSAQSETKKNIEFQQDDKEDEERENGCSCPTPEVLTKETPEVEDTQRESSLIKTPNRGKCILILCSIVQFCSTASFSCLSPFYPHEAQKKGMPFEVMGFVFSVFEIVSVITSPIFGNYMTRIGTKFVYLSGLFMAGSTSILFGTLTWCPPGIPFIVLSTLCRAVIAVGFSAFSVASFAIISNEFPDSVGTMFGIMETSHGIGLMVGPIIGSGLYQLGGFSAPFIVLGSLVLLVDVVVFLLLPHPKEGTRKEKQTMLSLIRSPLMLISMTNIGIVALGIGFFEVTLARHLKTYGVSVATGGLFFMIAPTTFGLFIPLWGYLCDKKGIISPLVVAGLASICIGYAVMGPSPWLEFLPRGPITVAAGLLLVGLGVGPLYVCIIKCMVVAAIEIGFDDNLDTYALVSGLFYSSFCAGAFFGPITGGLFAEKLGFPMSYTIVSLVNLTFAIVSFVFFIVRHNTRRKRSDKDNSSGQVTKEIKAL